jgi:enolase
LRRRAVAAPDAAHDDATRAMSVQEYIEKHDLTKKIEEALNAAVKAKADEPLAFVVRATRRD